MSAMVCGSKRSFFEEEDELFTSSSFKRRRFSPVRLASTPSLIEQLRERFPCMDIQTLERAIEESDDYEAAIKMLHELSLRHVAENTTAGEANGSAERGESASNGQATEPVDSSLHSNLPRSGPEWVEVLVGELSSATSIEDARCRASRILQSLEKSITELAGTEAAKSYYKENMALKEQREILLRENTVLKRAVAIQHERQKEFDSKNQEIHHLKQMLAQSQEHSSTLEVNNYALKLHLQQAQQKSSIPGHYHPDIY